MASQEQEEVLPGVKHIILVLSGKGGVGKSTIASQVALALMDRGRKVGVLDVDLCGPSLPRMFGLEGKDIHQSSAGWIPVYTDAEKRLGVMSIGFLLEDKEDAVVWRGPKKNAMIKQFLTDVVWGEVDYLVIDTPPGTSDEHITVVENLRGLNPDGVILVSTPQGVALADVQRELTFCRRTKLPVLGLVENMSGFVCPHCSECTNIFSTGGGQAFADKNGIPFLGTVPLDPTLAQCLEEGKSFVHTCRGSPSHDAVVAIAAKIDNDITLKSNQ